MEHASNRTQLVLWHRRRQHPLPLVLATLRRFRNSCNPVASLHPVPPPRSLAAGDSSHSYFPLRRTDRSDSGERRCVPLVPLRFLMSVAQSERTRAIQHLQTLRAEAGRMTRAPKREKWKRNSNLLMPGITDANNANCRQSPHT